MMRLGVLNMIGSDTNIVYSLYREPDLKVDETQGTGDTLKFEIWQPEYIIWWQRIQTDVPRP